MNVGDPNGINSLGRAGNFPFAPIPGKYGFIQINGVYLNLARWVPKQTAPQYDCLNFQSPQDANKNAHNEKVCNDVETTFTIYGVRDAASAAWWPTAGDQGTGVLGYSASYNWPINFNVQDVGGECNIKGVSAIEITIQTVGLALQVGRNGGA